MKCSSNSLLRLRVPSSESEEEEDTVNGGEDLAVQLQRPRRRLEAGFLGLKRIFAKVMVATMGCLFSCFRVKDSDLSPSLDSSASSHPGVSAVTRKRSPLSSLLVSDENDGLLTKMKEDQDLGTPKPELGFDLKELKDEAKFLKACGTITETPAEIRKVSQKWQDSSTPGAQNEYPEFKSWLTDTSIDKLGFETTSGELLTPSKDCDSVVKDLVSLEHTPNSCMTDGQRPGEDLSGATKGNDSKSVRSIELVASPSDSLTGSSITNGVIPQTVTCKNKSVRFDLDSDMSSASSKNYSSERFGEDSLQSGSSNSNASKYSPYPTPLKISDEMQTPGTVFPSYMNATGEGNNARIRCQYVYSVLNPVKNFSQLEELKSEDSNSNHQNNHIGELSEQTDDSSQQEVIDTLSSGENSKLEASLSTWLKRAPHSTEDNHVDQGSSILQKFRYGRTPGDRPILGMVAAHWNDNEPQVSPKWWDGNGIPNSTNKYKEDQKVSWHATPFEERLEKALSEEPFISQRNQVSKTPPPDFTEAEESDTAASQLHPSNHLKSVVSF
ncbi:OLC1v1024616C1 [Oldenlandia corymbosa var. corymbosa]|uniref:OLC1v1024616C1 n=1 Tax=Oldenlandia corymbosa var. corymbosa TaxID=529605 RepID=A0AAV1C464_OLDCO|nr:OLC1v1024616C1 [Oldenlandia corymbosa var. corymbosa]